MRESFCPAAASHSQPRQAGAKQTARTNLHLSVWNTFSKDHITEIKQIRPYIGRPYNQNRVYTDDKSTLWVPQIAPLEWRHMAKGTHRKAKLALTQRIRAERAVGLSLRDLHCPNSRAPVRRSVRHPNYCSAAVQS